MISRRPRRLSLQDAVETWSLMNTVITEPDRIVVITPLGYLIVDSEGIGGKKNRDLKFTYESDTIIFLKEATKRKALRDEKNLYQESMYVVESNVQRLPLVGAYAEMRLALRKIGEIEREAC